MSQSAKKSKSELPVIALNKKSSHDYFIEQRFEAGLSLEGWEVKSLRDKRLQLKESYVLVKNGELWLIGAHISPLPSASTHVNPDPTRTRKLLLHKKEIDTLIGQVDRKGYTLVITQCYWKKGRVKATLGLARGKQLHDKRESDKQRDWKRAQERLMKSQ